MTTLTLSEQRQFALAENGMMNCTLFQEPAAKVCNLDYLLHVTRGNKKIINNIVAVFFNETKKEMIDLNGAIKRRNYPVISDIAHKIKSAFSILGVTALEPVFKEMELLSSNTSPISNIELLNRRVNIVFNQAKEEMMIEN
jgi:HPt (histidine-containing phosphotransfer) domain-containing protein